MSDAISRCQYCGNPMDALLGLAMPVCPECWEKLRCDHWQKGYKCAILVDGEPERPYHCERPLPEWCEEYVHE
jgi:hypothetical protein